ncbi:MAG: peptide-methionine (R)-S-oxide reductase MsrB [Betaproteobacteria bacterium]|jgi:peptide-methionine (R)-S-oxide reductase|nr:MAG: peptide-methionine (R)-S-oxide reductase MsrB [Betaproteobacteria bacterium]
MDRRRLLTGISALPFLHWCVAAAGETETGATVKQFAVLNRPKAEWKKLLEPARYEILFEEDTERPGSSPLNREKRMGLYICAACYLPLFDAKYKYESGTGWPSFTQPIEGRLGTKKDYKLVWPRIEYHCARCGGHQGHVFDDGPAPRGERWCNNGLALLFVPQGEALPALRT